MLLFFLALILPRDGREGGGGWFAQHSTHQNTSFFTASRSNECVNLTTKNEYFCYHLENHPWFGKSAQKL